MDLREVSHLVRAAPETEDQSRKSYGVTQYDLPEVRGCTITPDKTRRIDFQQMVCPECGERFVPEKRE
jgi:hypothetical protein